LGRTLKSGWISVRGWRPFGAEILIHWPLVVAFVAGIVLVARDPAFLALVFASYFVVLVVHEAGHTWMARRLGMRVQGLEFSLVHGRCTYISRDATPFDHARIAMAGPLAQLALAATVILAAQVPAIRDLDPFGPVLVFAGYFNVVWAAVNLLPGRGLDGEHAWKMFARRPSPSKPPAPPQKKPNPLRRVK
jgi:Zn-dependent protease